MGPARRVPLVVGGRVVVAEEAPEDLGCFVQSSGSLWSGRGVQIRINVTTGYRSDENGAVSLSGGEQVPL